MSEIYLSFSSANTDGSVPCQYGVIYKLLMLAFNVVVFLNIFLFVSLSLSLSLSLYGSTAL
jgi:hypothetical protein